MRKHYFYWHETSTLSALLKTRIELTFFAYRESHFSYSALNSGNHWIDRVVGSCIPVRNHGCLPMIKVGGGGAPWVRTMIKPLPLTPHVNMRTQGLLNRKGERLSHQGKA